MSWLCLQDGKDYIPLTADADVSPVAPDPRSPCNRPQSRELLDVQLHYDSPPTLGSAPLLFIPSWFHKRQNTHGCSLLDVPCAESPSRVSSAVGPSASRRLNTSPWQTAASWCVGGMISLNQLKPFLDSE